MNTMSSRGTGALNDREKGDLDALINKMYGCKHLKNIKNVKALCHKAKGILREEPNIVNVACPVTICGDTHGQHHDLMEMFDIVGKCPTTNFLFLGDYVDRGMYSVECFTLLIALKVRHPTRISLLRGNHECQSITAVYGFYDEVLHKYGTSKVWEYFCSVFELLPVAAVIEGKIFCLHGGLSPSLDKLDDIRAINRVKEPGEEGMLCDLLWSDPNEDNNFEGFGVSPRGAGYTWGKDISEKWIYNNDLTFIARGHQLVMDGFEERHKGLVCTVFSCPNYIYRMNNLGAVMQVAEDLSHEVITFETAGPKYRQEPAKKPKEYFN